MREIDLLPDWYVDMHRRKRRLRTQAALVGVICLVFVAWAAMNIRDLTQAHALLTQKQSALLVSEQRVRERAVQQQLRDQLRTQDRVESSLGLNVESSRVLGLVSKALPESASISEFSIDTEEHTRPLLQQVAVKNSPPAVPDRRLLVTLKCVAPANIDVATTLENLTNSGVCDDLRLDYAKEKVADGAIMREFQVNFRVNLNSEANAE